MSLGGFPTRWAGSGVPGRRWGSWPGLPESGLVRPTAWSLTGQDGAAKVNRGFPPHRRSPGAGGNSRASPGTLPTGSGLAAAKTLTTSPTPSFGGQDFALPVPPYCTPHHGGRGPTGDALGGMEGQNWKGDVHPEPRCPQGPHSPWQTTRVSIDSGRTDKQRSVPPVEQFWAARRSMPIYAAACMALKSPVPSKRSQTQSKYCAIPPP